MLLRSFLDILSLRLRSIFSIEYGPTRNSSSEENHPINTINYKLESPKLVQYFQYLTKHSFGYNLDVDSSLKNFFETYSISSQPCDLFRERRDTEMRGYSY